MNANIKKQAYLMVVEDEKHLAQGLKLNLTLHGHLVFVAEDGEVAITEFKKQKFDLLIIDLMLPKIDGFKVVAEVRKYNARVPILILSAKDAGIDKVRSLELGVDDYLTKPFNLDELLLRTDRLLLRSSWNITGDEIEGEELGVFSFGKSWADLKTGEGHGPAGEIFLTEQERKLLVVFIKHNKEILSRDQLLSLAWGYEKGLETRTVDSFIVRLRKYFEENPKRPKHFISIRMRGYLFDPGKDGE
ncbi:MAG: response regulator transcription factor [Bdellovibrio sp.]|nr:response regulator transcription factor [Bdellovibrio sp.]